MTLFKKITVFLLGFVLAAGPVLGQTPAFPWGSLPRQQRALDESFKKLLEQPRPRDRHTMTFERVMTDMQQNGNVDACLLLSVISDEKYLLSLDVNEAAELAAVFPYAWMGYGDCKTKLLDFLFARLAAAPYDPAAADFPVTVFYAAALTGLGRHPLVGREVENRLFERVEAASGRADSARGGIWASVVLINLAEESPEGEWPTQMSGTHRELFERRLSKAIARFDWLQSMPVDYMLTGVKSSKAWGSSNQAVLISLFAQANSFWAMKKDDGMLKQFVSTGGLNDLGRAAMHSASEDSHPRSFSDNGETFYLHHPTPGTDGQGHYVDSANGRRHQVLNQLVQALCVSYTSGDRSAEEKSALIQQFVRGYLTTDRDDYFVHYLYIPLVAMRAGQTLLFASTLYGWDREEKALQNELYEKLKEGYPWSVTCTSVQGACEVAAEWMAVGKVFGWVFKGLGWGAKTASRAVVSRLPAQALMNLAVVEVSGKLTVRWCRQSIKTLLKTCGWKAAAAGAAAAGLTSDTRRPPAEAY